MAGQLAAFAGLRTLRDLDLYDLGVHEILGGYAEAPGSNLLDLRNAFATVTCRVLATFAGIGPRTDPVHRDCERFVRLW